MMHKASRRRDEAARLMNLALGLLDADRDCLTITHLELALEALGIDGEEEDSTLVTMAPVQGRG